MSIVLLLDPILPDHFKSLVSNKSLYCKVGSSVCHFGFQWRNKARSRHEELKEQQGWGERNYSDSKRIKGRGWGANISQRSQKFVIL